MRIFCILFATTILLSCKSKQTDLNSDAPIKPNQFVSAFKLLDNNFSATDSNIIDQSDTVLINHKLLERFIPDTLYRRLLADDKKTIFHPIGRVEKNNEIYLLLLTIQNRKKIVTVILQDKKNTFLSTKDILNSDKEKNNYKYSFSLNREPTFFVNREKLVNDKEIKFTKIGWAFNGKSFIPVVNESNEYNSKSIGILNPIDTLPRENLYSGNYVEDEGNFISIRDGRTKQDYLFFLHIEKNDGNCIGELKGEMHLTDSTHAIYKFGGDPCVIDFNFDKNVVVVKEEGSCGNRRGMNCKFEDAYTKKKEPKKKTIKPTIVKIPTANVTKMMLPAKTKPPVKVEKKKIIKPGILMPKPSKPKTEDNPYIN